VTADHTRIGGRGRRDFARSREEVVEREGASNLTSAKVFSYASACREGPATAKKTKSKSTTGV